MYANPEFHIATPSLRVLIALVLTKYTVTVSAAEATSVNWDTRFTKGIVMQYDYKYGGTRCCVLHSDADLAV